ncbi:hypothetical protein GQ472_01700 [archaeon]|nr:hypothetical protein [archaeon]
MITKFITKGKGKSMKFISIRAILLLFIICGSVLCTITPSAYASVDDTKVIGEIPAGFILGLTENITIPIVIQLFIVAFVGSVLLILIMKL